MKRATKAIRHSRHHNHRCSRSPLTEERISFSPKISVEWEKGKVQIWNGGNKSGWKKHKRRCACSETVWTEVDRRHSFQIRNKRFPFLSCSISREVAFPEGGAWWRFWQYALGTVQWRNHLKGLFLLLEGKYFDCDWLTWETLLWEWTSSTFGQCGNGQKSTSFYNATTLASCLKRDEMWLVALHNVGSFQNKKPANLTRWFRKDRWLCRTTSIPGCSKR